MMKWAGHVERVKSREMHTGLWWRNLKEVGHFECTDVYGRIILKQI
jgi:hypothetical protein